VSRYWSCLVSANPGGKRPAAIAMVESPSSSEPSKSSPMYRTTVESSSNGFFLDSSKKESSLIAWTEGIVIQSEVLHAQHSILTDHSPS